MTDHQQQLCQILVHGSDNEKLTVLRAMREEVTESAPPEYFQAVKSLIASENNDIRWQSLIVVGEFIPSSKWRGEIWDLIVRYSGHDEDMQDALATLLLEHLLEYHFTFTFRKVQLELAKGATTFLDLLARCWPFGKAAQQWGKIEELIQQYQK